MIFNNFMIKIIFSLSLLFPIFGKVKTDKLLLCNSNTYSGIYSKTLNNKVFFKVNQNNEVDSVQVSEIQLLKLSTGSIIIKDGTVIGKINIEDLAVRNVRQSIASSFKWKALGAASIPSSMLTGALFWN
jgi:hypothetical protein